MPLSPCVLSLQVSLVVFQSINRDVDDVTGSSHQNRFPLHFPCFRPLPRSTSRRFPVLVSFCFFLFCLQSDDIAKIALSLISTKSREAQFESHPMPEGPQQKWLTIQHDSFQYFSSFTTKMNFYFVSDISSSSLLTHSPASTSA